MEISFAKNQTLTLTITHLSFEGNGIAKVDNFVFFVPFSAIGDVILGKIVKRKKRYAFVKILEILTPSPSRISVDCPAFYHCGGCSFRHISYQEELIYKKEMVGECLQKLNLDTSSLFPCTPSPSVNGYRNKSQMPFALEDGRLITGFYAKRSHRVIPLQSCLLEPPIFAEIRKDIVSFFSNHHILPYDEINHTGVLRHVYLRFAQDHTLQLILVITSPISFLEEKFVSFIKEKFPQIISICINYNSKKTNVVLGDKTQTLYGPPYLKDILCHVELQISPSSFYQVNHGAATLLYQKIQEFSDLSTQDTLLDLYCGIGSIGLSLASQVKELFGIEVISSAVENAKINGENNQIQNATFFLGDAQQGAEQLKNMNITPHCVILDPPRKGCGESLLTLLLQMNPPRLVMVSCNPQTLAEDLSFLQQHGYMIHAIQPFDLFPRTNHVECVVLLTRVDK